MERKAVSICVLTRAPDFFFFSLQMHFNCVFETTQVTVEKQSRSTNTLDLDARCLMIFPLGARAKEKTKRRMSNDEAKTRWKHGAYRNDVSIMIGHNRVLAV